MAIKFARVKTGDVLYDARKKRRGGQSRMSCWEVKILDIDHEKGQALCRWNNNRPRLYTKCQIEKLRRSKPKVK